MDTTTQAAPLTRGRNESRRIYSLRVLTYLAEQGVPDLVTADEALRVAEQFGVHAGKKGDHSTPYNRAALALRIATHQKG